MMETGKPESISFEYNGKKYNGYLISSIDLEPHYHWFFFEDEEMIAKVDECIAFSHEDGILHTVHPYYGHYELVSSIKVLVEQQLLAKNLIG